MKTFSYNTVKDKLLEETRGVGFEDMITLISKGNIVDDIIHPNQRLYPGQCIYMVNYGGYIYMVPYVETDWGIFLKTIIPSRKMTKYYLREI